MISVIVNRRDDFLEIAKAEFLTIIIFNTYCSMLKNLFYMQQQIMLLALTSGRTEKA